MAKVIVERPRRGVRSAPLRKPGRTRVVTSHDPRGGVAEADVVLGLRGGRAEVLGPAAGVDAETLGALYR